MKGAARPSPPSDSRTRPSPRKEPWAPQPTRHSLPSPRSPEPAPGLNAAPQGWGRPKQGTPQSQTDKKWPPFPALGFGWFITEWY